MSRLVLPTLTLLLTFSAAHLAVGQPGCDEALYDHGRVALQRMVSNYTEALVATGYRYALPSSDRRWDVDGPNSSYDQVFSTIRYGNRFLPTPTEVLEKRKDAILRSDGLDLMGSGFAFKRARQEGRVSSVTGMRLGAYPSPELLGNFLARMHRPHEIVGDILDPAVWQALDVHMRQRGIKAMHVITMRPVWGWSETDLSLTAERASLAFRFILTNVLMRIAEDGVFYFSLGPNPRATHDHRGAKRPGLFYDPEFLAFERFIETHTNHRLVYNMAQHNGHAAVGALIPKSWSPIAGPP